eukprot:CAMPEP_0174832552 /NCGR_PEP_ID=MMETSP1114-20130205/3737_1 /TAXON_ID=312471 /ORGANISM="Neobodo designis, Strain CCAP 1951/1" /LENGTH=847 /DNA_ID=CAMNT_0016066413 /DNA_START=88 /DNA_END=2631 /DNA_ORIENTATION=-
MPCLSLRGTIGALTAAVVLVVAVTTLAITLSVSLAALREIGKHHAEALVITATKQLENYFEVPKRTIFQIANFSRGPGIMYPSENEASLSRWVDINCFAQRFSMGQYGVVATWFNDGNYVACWDEFRDPALYGAYITRVYPNRSVVNDGIWYYKANNTMAPKSHWIYAAGSDISSLEDWRDAGMLPVLRTGTVGGTTNVWLTLQVINVGGTVDVMAVAAAPLFNASDARIGYSTLTIQMTQLSRFVRGIGGTPNTRVFAVDYGGYLFASSMEAQAPFLSHTIEPRDTRPPSGCATSQTVLDVDSVQVTIACRVSATSYPYAPLNAVANDRAFLRTPTRAVRFTKVDGANYYTVAGPVDLSMPGLSLSLVVTMPEEDIVGDVVTGRNIAIGVTAGVFVLASVISFVLISKLLAPLPIISERMFKAAAFEDDADAAANEYSSMDEIFQLQDAFYSMSFELNRIKSFVPQSVLQSRVNNDDLDLDEDEPELTSASGISVDLHRRGSSANLGGSAKVSSAHYSSDMRSERSLTKGRSGDCASTVRSSKVGSRKGHPAVAALKTAAGLNRENVTVLVINFRGFHDKLADSDIDTILHNFDDAVTAVLQHVNDNKGVLDTFHGDRFLATFNAVRRCASHSRRGVAAARGAIAALENAAFRIPATAAVVTGRCQVGNVGSDQMKKFNILGPAVTQAALLERMTKLYPGTSCIVPEKVFPDVSAHHSLRYLDIVRLPGATKPCLVADVTGEISAEAEGEWLYVVSQHDESPKSTLRVPMINEAFACLARGDVAAATSMFKKQPSAAAALPENTAMLPALLDAAHKMPEPAAGRTSYPVVSDHGTFFTALSATSKK